MRCASPSTPVLAHDVLNGFDGVRTTWLCDLLIEGVLQFVDGRFKALLAAERLDELDDVPIALKGVITHVGVVEIENALVLIFASSASSTARACGRIW